MENVAASSACVAEEGEQWSHSFTARMPTAELIGDSLFDRFRYAMESECHQGNLIVYETVEKVSGAVLGVLVRASR